MNTQAELIPREGPNYVGATFPEPRPFQIDAHEALRQGVREGHRCQMLMAATGAGKTFLGLRVIHEGLRKGRRAVFVCDRRNLIDQTSAVADRYGLSAHGVIMSDHWRYDPDMPFQIASAQTLARREWPKSDIVVIDEAHTQHSAWVEHIKSTSAVVIGLSATPFSPGLGKLFSNLVNAGTMHDLTQSGVLVPLRVMSCKKADMSGAATSGGEWTDAAAAERGMEIVGDVVTEWHTHGEGRKTIVFGSTIAHCEEICRQFNESGVMAAVFCADTPQEERRAHLQAFAKPDSILRVLISVEALAKGMDVPDVSCVVDCRPLRKSLSTAIQMWGRGLRSSPSTGKTDCLLLDHSGNIIRFREDFERIFFHGLDALDAGEKLDKDVRREPEEKEVKACPACSFKPMLKRCMGCGFEIETPAMVEHVPGHMQEVVIGKQKAAENHQHLYEQICTYTRGHGNAETAKKRAAHLFREFVGEWPDRYHFERTPSVEITRPVMNRIKARNIQFAKAKQAGKTQGAPA